MDKTFIFFLPSTQNKGGSDRGGLPAAVRNEGNRERRSRSTDSRPHLGWRRPVEVDRRRRASCNRDGMGGGGWRLGRERGRPVRLGGEAGVARVRFIGAGRRCSAWVEHAKLVLACSNGGPASLQ
jgi:hypothetical protein